MFKLLRSPLLASPRAEEHYCSICHNACGGAGNDGWPMTDSRCCDSCYQMMVAPAQLRAEAGDWLLCARIESEEADVTLPDPNVPMSNDIPESDSLGG